MSLSWTYLIWSVQTLEPSGCSTWNRSSFVYVNMELVRTCQSRRRIQDIWSRRHWVMFIFARLHSSSDNNWDPMLESYQKLGAMWRDFFSRTFIIMKNKNCHKKSLYQGVHLTGKSEKHCDSMTGIFHANELTCRLKVVSYSLLLEFFIRAGNLLSLLLCLYHQAISQVKLSTRAHWYPRSFVSGVYSSNDTLHHAVLLKN